MRAASSSALFLSLTIHALAAALLVLMTMFLMRPEATRPMIFELVAGEPTAPEQTEAPAFGNTLALKVPRVETPRKVEPETVDEPIAPPQPQPKAPPKQAAKEPAKPKTEPKKAVEAPKQPAKMTYDQFVKQHGQPKTAKSSDRPRAIKAPRVDVAGIAGGVRGGSTANTKGGGGGRVLSRSEQTLLENYIAQLIQALRLAHEKPPGLSDDLAVEVTFDIAPNGAINNARITRSSGYREFDQSALAAFRRVRSIGPVPDGRGDTWTIKFRAQEAE